MSKMLLFIGVSMKCPIRSAPMNTIISSSPITTPAQGWRTRPNRLKAMTEKNQASARMKIS